MQARTRQIESPIECVSADLCGIAMRLYVNLIMK